MIEIDIENFANLPFGYAAVGTDMHKRQFVLWSTVRGSLDAAKKAAENTKLVSFRYTLIGFVKVAVTPLEIVEKSI